MNDPQREAFAQRILDFVFEAGRISLDHIQNSNPTFKKDRSVLTIADKKISELLADRLRDLVQSSEHLIIDEEKENVSKLIDDKLLGRAKYMWVLDPIDGTRSYANGMPQYGISLGLLREGRPWMGAVYFPMLRELFFADGEAAFFIKDPFSPGEVRRPIKPAGAPLDGRAVLLCDINFFNLFRFDHFIQIMISGTSVVDLTWPSIGRGCGAVFGSHIWDFSGAWPIFEAAGLKLRSIKKGAPLERIEAKLFKDNWKLREYHILSSAADYKTLRARIK